MKRTKTMRTEFSNLFSIHSFNFTPPKRTQSFIHLRWWNHFKSNQISPLLTFFVQMVTKQLQFYMILTPLSLVLKHYRNMNARKETVVLQQWRIMAFIAIPWVGNLSSMRNGPMKVRHTTHVSQIPRQHAAEVVSWHSGRIKQRRRLVRRKFNKSLALQEI